MSTAVAYFLRPLPYGVWAKVDLSATTATQYSPTDSKGPKTVSHPQNEDIGGYYVIPLFHYPAIPLSRCFDVLAPSLWSPLPKSPMVHLLSNLVLCLCS